MMRRGDSIAYDFGDTGELRTIRDPLGNVTTFGYNSDLLMNRIAYAGGTVDTLVYSATHGLLSSGFNNASIDSAFGRDYVEDSLSRVREIRARTLPVRGFAYDSAGQLMNYADTRPTLSSCQLSRDYGLLCTESATFPLASESYVYDKVGNRLRAGDTTAWNNRLARSGGDTIIYDPDGNMTRRYRLGNPSVFDQTLTWNSLGQLTQVATTRSGNTLTLQFGYDGLGRRVTKTVPGNPSIHYIWDAVGGGIAGGAYGAANSYRPGGSCTEGLK